MPKVKPQSAPTVNPKAPLYDQQGQVVGQLSLPARLFGQAWKGSVVQQAVRAQAANRRVTLAHTKTRGEVRGGGRKPWKQKGTGRARQGSIRAPQWIGGGIAFGPTSERNFSLRINQKAKQKALAMVLSDKVRTDRLLALQSLELPAAKTRELAQVLKRLPLSGHTTLLVLPGKQETVARAARNLPTVKALSAGSLNVEDVLRYDFVLLPQDSLPVIEATYKLVS